MLRASDFFDFEVVLNTFCDFNPVILSEAKDLCSGFLGSAIDDQLRGSFASLRMTAGDAQSDL